VPLAFEGRPLVSVCHIASVSIFLCVGMMAIFCGVEFFSGDLIRIFRSEIFKAYISYSFRWIAFVV
jgi:hypothetical protein